MRRTNGLGKILQVGWRDFRYTALTPAFLMAVVGLPLLLGIAALVIYPILLSQETSKLEGKLVVVDEQGDVAELVEAVLERGLRNKVAEEMAKAISSLPGSGLTGEPKIGFMNVPIDEVRYAASVALLSRRVDGDWGRAGRGWSLFQIRAVSDAGPETRPQGPLREGCRGRDQVLHGHVRGRSL